VNKHFDERQIWQGFADGCTGFSTKLSTDFRDHFQNLEKSMTYRDFQEKT
jgi:hypothetical protein